MGRFEAEFGGANGAHSVGNISFVNINSMALDLPRDDRLHQLTDQ